MHSHKKRFGRKKEKRKGTILLGEGHAQIDHHGGFFPAAAETLVKRHCSDSLAEREKDEQTKEPKKQKGGIGKTRMRAFFPGRRVTLNGRERQSGSFHCSRRANKLSVFAPGLRNYLAIVWIVRTAVFSFLFSFPLSLLLALSRIPDSLLPPFPRA